MAEEMMTAPTANYALRATQVYLMGGLCLAVGLGLGYVSRASLKVEKPVQTQARSGMATRPGSVNPHDHKLTLEEMKKVADHQAAPLLEKLKSDPRNVELLMQVGAVYHTTHQFQQAAAYYRQAADAAPKNVAVRTKLASSLYRSGDVDGALTELNRALKQDPKDANALFDLGMIKMEGKNDAKGAVAAWRQLLRSNPQLSTQRREMVQKLMSNAIANATDEHALKGAANGDR